MTDHEQVASRLRRIADRYQPPDGLDQVARRIHARRRHRRVRRGGAAILGAALVAAIIVTISTQNGPGSQRVNVGTASPTPQHVAPLADPAVTPKGWSPVQVGNIEISVPSPWFVEDDGTACGGHVTGEVFIQRTPHIPPNLGCPPVANVVSIDTAARPAESRQAVVNGIPTVRSVSMTGRQRWLTEWALNERIEARGPQARRILATLTHSPRSVLLHSTINTTPHRWRTVTFGGLRFAVPASWKQQNQSLWPGCDNNLQPRRLQLLTANSTTTVSCTTPGMTARADAGVPGLLVAAGPAISNAPATATCTNRDHLRICIDPQPTGNDFHPGHGINLLTAQIYIPNHAHPDQIEIGLPAQASNRFASSTPSPQPTPNTALDKPPTSDPSTSPKQRRKPARQPGSSVETPLPARPGAPVLLRGHARGMAGQNAQAEAAKAVQTLTVTAGGSFSLRRVVYSRDEVRGTHLD